MKRTGNRAETLRMGLVLGIVFLLTLVLGVLVIAPVMTVLLYLVWTYRQRIKNLESRIEGTKTQPRDGPQSAPLPPSEPPTSNDA